MADQFYSIDRDTQLRSKVVNIKRRARHFASQYQHLWPLAFASQIFSKPQLPFVLM